MTHAPCRACNWTPDTVAIDSAAPPRPGSYAWPEVRKRVEHALAAGTPLQRITATLADPRPFGRARPPSRATLQRWRRERRWLTDRPPPVAAT